MVNTSEEFDEAAVHKLDGDITRLFKDFTFSAAFLLADADIIRQWFVANKVDKDNNNDERTKCEYDETEEGENTFVKHRWIKGSVKKHS